MFKEQSGLTLVELLVVAGIIMVLTAVVIPNLNQGNNRLKTIRAAYQINQDIRRAQELALASTECKECEGCSLVEGYGLHFDRNSDQSYILFGDCNGDGIYDDGEQKEK